MSSDFAFESMGDLNDTEAKFDIVSRQTGEDDHVAKSKKRKPCTGQSSGC
jgi:hypothetical protein